MRKSAETTARSTEPWAIARSRPPLPDQPRQPRRAPGQRPALPSVEAPPWLPTAVYGNPEPLEDPQRLPVLARGDEDLVPARLAAARSIGRRTSGCAAAVQSTQTLKRRSVTVRATIATAGITCRGCAQPRSPPSPRLRLRRGPPLRRRRGGRESLPHARGAALLCPNLRIGRPPGSTSSAAAGGAAAGDQRRPQPRPRPDGAARRRATARARCGSTSGSTAPAAARSTSAPAPRLHFTDVGAYFGGSYWKVHRLARFELRRVGPATLGRVVRTGPKLNYCLRDLERTRPGRRSPQRAALPRLQPGPLAARHPRHLGRLVGHLPGRLRQAVDQRRRPARLLRLRR